MKADAVWSPELSTGIRFIDEQHQALFARVARLAEAMREGFGNDEVHETLEYLVEYALEHFRAEEELFDEHHYPQAAHHKEEHAAFTRRVEAFLSRLSRDNTALSLEVAIFLGDWLDTHIREDDMKYVAFFREQGVGDPS